MQIHELLTPKHIVLDVKAADKFQSIHALIDLFSDLWSTETLKQVRDAVITRESIMSTGVGQALAIPHGKTDALLDTYVAFARLSTPVDFESIDKQPVQLIFLLVGPHSDHRNHIKRLSRISKLMNYGTFRDGLYRSSSPEQIIQVIKETEQHYF